MDSSVSQKDEIWFLRVCHHISNAVYHCTTAALMLSDLTLRSFSKAKLVDVAWLKSVGCVGRMVE